MTVDDDGRLVPERPVDDDLFVSSRVEPPVGLGAGRERSPTFREDREFLERLFPRGRLRVNESGEPCLVATARAHRGWELTRDGPGVCVYWLGRRSPLAGLSSRRQEVACEREGFFYPKLVNLADRLPMFSKRPGRGNPEALARWRSK